MFLLFSKFVWFFLQPSSLIIAMLIVAVLLRRYLPALSRRLLIAATACLVLLSVGPVGNLLMAPLENRFPQMNAGDLEQPPYGIIILGGAEQSDLVSSRKVLAVNHRAERIIEGVLLARRFPSAKVIVADTMTLELLVELDVTRSRIILEKESSNTFENALLSARLSQSGPGEAWLLLTSAYHMPRAVGSFRKVGLAVLPWPVDFRTRKDGTWMQLFYRPSTGLRTVDLAAKEWVGMLAYWLTGRSSALFPAPQ